MANLRAQLKTAKLNTLRRLKKILQDNLSLSSKLFLRGLLATSSRAFHKLAQFPARISGRRASPGYSPKAPALTAADLDAIGTHPALKQPSATRSAASIQTSIIIPVFNKVEFTFQCLRSLLDQVDFDANEVIVVDNASTDDTPDVLSRFSSIATVIRNEQNRGFVEACNQGAETARGEYLVFLNNDTQVLPGWLDHLVETVEVDSQAGAVGSMLIYPDGTIQEAGSIVWQDGNAYHYGGGGSPDDRRFNFAREVDYCSAASLLIRADLFRQLRGFDMRYAPAYYEDVDLCFGVRSLGFKVIYQPMSRVIHFEGVTAGVDVTSGMKQFQVTNRTKFVEKWKATLDRDYLPQDMNRVAEASLRNRDWPRVVVFDERVPTPDRDAGSLRMFLILREMAKWSHVIFVPFSEPHTRDYEQVLWKEGIETAEAVDYRRVLSHKNVRAAIVSRPTMGEAWTPRIRRLNPKARIIFDMVDTHFLRLQREHEISGDRAALDESKRYRKLEKRIAQESDVVWSASSEDRLVMQREVEGKRIEVVPTIHTLRDPGEPFASRDGLIFIGNQVHRPNRDAVLFYLREVHPLVQKALPDVTLDIIGDNPSPETIAFDSSQVRIRGYVPDVEPYLNHARVFVAPLRFGAGIKGKVGEAMAHGLPVVTTSIGAEGFGLTHEFDVMIADDPESFAGAIVRLYSEADLWERIALNSRLRIEQNFTPEVVAETIYKSINCDEVGTTPR